MKLARFQIEGDTYEVFCEEMELCEDRDMNSDVYLYPEFTGLSATKMVAGEMVPFEPSGASWSRAKYCVEDMIRGAIVESIINNGNYQIEYLEPTLQGLVESYKKDVALTAKNLDIPKRVLYRFGYDLFTLYLVTDKYIYYAFYAELLMLDAETHGIITDNYFASVGFEDSREAIQRGEETVMWVCDECILQDEEEA